MSVNRPGLWGLAAWLWLVGLSHTQAQPHIHTQAPTPADTQVALLVAEDAEPRPGFALSLRIHLPVDVAVIEAGTLRAGLSTSERIEQALGVVELHQAQAALWVEGPVLRADGDREFVLYVIGRRHDRAIVDVLRLTSTGDVAASTPDTIDRSLALKVSHLLSDVTRGDDLIDTPLSPGAPDAVVVSGESKLQALVLVGASVHSPTGSLPTQAGLRLGVGLQVADTSQWLACLWSVRLMPRSERNNASGALELEEITASLELSWLHRLGSFALGAHLGAMLRSLDATGTTALGSVGDRHSFVAGPVFGPSASWLLHSNLRIDLGARLELATQRVNYRVNDTELGDSGRVRLGLQLDLLGQLP